MRYYRDTIEEFEKLAPDEESVLEYIKKIKTVSIEGVLVDIDAFSRTRWQCSAQCSHTCCDGGGICTPANERKALDFIPLTYKYLPIENTKKIETGRMKCKEYKLAEEQGRCILYFEENGYGRCALHRVALDRKIPIQSVKSFDCFIEPLELIWLNDGKLFMTISIKENTNIVRWKCMLPCMEKQQKTAPYAYVTLKDVIIYILGSDFYDKFRLVIEKEIV